MWKAAFDITEANWRDPCGGQVGDTRQNYKCINLSPSLAIYPTDISAHMRNDTFKILHFGIVNNDKGLETAQRAIRWD